PHIGHAYTSLLCDVVARFMRLAGKKVKFTSGTNEHRKKSKKRLKQRVCSRKYLRMK
ncbi:class I tRNA ligase family protein, partial [Wolbachia endosymbiont of Atemnus politus]|nr:class I tRNA ligase family protein [Wolbachia endosymbiont of Atemnus politus]